MSSLPLAGPSSPLRANSAEVRRVVNWVSVRIESATGKGGAQSYLKQVAGLTKKTAVGTAIRALKTARGRLFAVADSSLVEVNTDLTLTPRGNITTGVTGVAANDTQLCIVTGSLGYAFDLSANTLALITTNWRGSTTVSVLDTYGIFAVPGEQQFYISAPDDFTSLDALQFASAEGSVGKIVATIVRHHELYIFKELGAEVWDDTGVGDFPFARNDTAVLEIGCAARASLCRLAGVLYWLGQDEEGNGVVFGMPGYAAARVSSQALEEMLAGLVVSEASAWTYHQEGLSFYVLNVPGLETTWVYEASSGLWHERAEWVDGAWQPWRATCHAVAFGKHYVGDSAGNLYELDPRVNDFAGDVMRRNWISPHNAAPNLATQRFGSFEVVCDTGAGLPDGTAPTMLLRYSNDGGREWQDWSELSLGAIGERRARARDTMLGSGKDRVWEIVITDAVACNPVSVEVNEQ